MSGRMIAAILTTAALIGAGAAAHADVPTAEDFTAVLLVFSLVIPVFADDTTSALINQALDKQSKLTLNHLLPQAMEIIEKQTGVPMKADPAVWDLLPWGQGTNINAKIEKTKAQMTVLQLQFERLQAEGQSLDREHQAAVADAYQKAGF